MLLHLSTKIVVALSACQALQVTNNVKMIAIRTQGADTLADSNLLVTLAAIVVGISGIAVENFWVSMSLIGIAGCFLCISGTALVTEVCRPAEGTKMQGVNDTLIHVKMSASSLMSGAILYRFGWHWLNCAALPLLSVTTAAIRWLAWQRRIAAGGALAAAAE